MGKKKKKKIEVICKKAFYLHNFAKVDHFKCLYDSCKLTGTPVNDAGQPEKCRKGVNITICRLSLIVLSIFMQHTYFVYFEFELRRV